MAKHRESAERGKKLGLEIFCFVSSFFANHFILHALFPQFEIINSHIKAGRTDQQILEVQYLTIFTCAQTIDHR